MARKISILPLSGANSLQGEKIQCSMCSWAVYHCLESLSTVHMEQRGRGKTKGIQLALHVTKHKSNKSSETNWQQEREEGMRTTTLPWIWFIHRGASLRVYFQQPCITASNICIYCLATLHWYCYGLFCKIGLCNLSWFMVRLIAWPFWPWVRLHTLCVYV